MSEILHIILNMSTHYNGILEVKLNLSEEQGEKTCVVPHVFYSFAKFEPNPVDPLLIIVRQGFIVSFVMHESFAQREQCY